MRSTSVADRRSAVRLGLTVLAALVALLPAGCARDRGAITLDEFAQRYVRLAPLYDFSGSDVDDVTRRFDEPGGFYPNCSRAQVRASSLSETANLDDRLRFLVAACPDAENLVVELWTANAGFTEAEVNELFDVARGT